jgi:Fic family protein
VLLQFSGKDERHRGDFKKNPNNVVAKDADGNIIGVVFETATPFETPREMENLVGWLKAAIDDGDLHPLLIVGIFAVWFLAIHPFQDGNGRLSRILTTLLLLRFGYAYVPYSSLESVIEDNKAGYYAALRRTQQSMKTDAPDWGAWLVFFLRCLVGQKKKLEKRIADEKSVVAELSGLSLSIVNLLAEKDSVTVAGVVAATSANRNTVKAALQRLVKKGLLSQWGKGRGVHYTLA